MYWMTVTGNVPGCSAVARAAASERRMCSCQWTADARHLVALAGASAAATGVRDEVRRRAHGHGRRSAPQPRMYRRARYPAARAGARCTAQLLALDSDHCGPGLDTVAEITQFACGRDSDLRRRSPSPA